MKINDQINELTQAVAEESWKQAQILCSALLDRRLNKEQRATVEALQEEIPDSVPRRSQSEQMRAYKARYQKTVAASGSSSMNNGDPVAEFLAGMSAKEVCRLADRVLDEDAGYHEAKYEGLNEGSRRMNAGNRLRAAYKRGEWDEPTES